MAVGSEDFLFGDVCFATCELQASSHRWGDITWLENDSVGKNPRSTSAPSLKVWRKAARCSENWARSQQPIRAADADLFFRLSSGFCYFGIFLFLKQTFFFKFTDFIIKKLPVRFVKFRFPSWIVQMWFFARTLLRCVIWSAGVTVFHSDFRLHVCKMNWNRDLWHFLRHISTSALRLNMFPHLYIEALWSCAFAHHSSSDTQTFRVRYLYVL